MDILDFLNKDYKLILDIYKPNNKVELCVDFGSNKMSTIDIEKYFSLNFKFDGRNLSLDGIDFLFSGDYSNPTNWYLICVSSDSTKTIIQKLNIDMQKIDFFSRKEAIKREMQEKKEKLCLIEQELDKLNLEFL